jgi:hypothetical protein
MASKYALPEALFRRKWGVLRAFLHVFVVLEKAVFVCFQRFRRDFAGKLIFACFGGFLRAEILAC